MGGRQTSRPALVARSPPVDVGSAYVIGLSAEIGETNVA